MSAIQPTVAELADRLADSTLTPARRAVVVQDYRRAVVAEFGIDAYSLASAPKPGGAS